MDFSDDTDEKDGTMGRMAWLPTTCDIRQRNGLATPKRCRHYSLPAQSKELAGGPELESVFEASSEVVSFYEHHLSPSLSPTKAWRRGGHGALDGGLVFGRGLVWRWLGHAGTG